MVLKVENMITKKKPYDEGIKILQIRIKISYKL